MTESQRGGYRGKHAVKFSRRLPTIKATAYRMDYDKLSNLAKNINIPIIELIHRIVNHKNFNLVIRDITDNIEERWHEQDIIQWHEYPRPQTREEALRYFIKCPNSQFNSITANNIRKNFDISISDIIEYRENKQ